jgi:hypothetical protein
MKNGKQPAYPIIELNEEYGVKIDKKNCLILKRA